MPNEIVVAMCNRAGRGDLSVDRSVLQYITDLETVAERRLQVLRRVASGLVCGRECPICGVQGAHAGSCDLAAVLVSSLTEGGGG